MKHLPPIAVGDYIWTSRRRRRRLLKGRGHRCVGLTVVRPDHASGNKQGEGAHRGWYKGSIAKMTESTIEHCRSPSSSFRWSLAERRPSFHPPNSQEGWQ